MIFFTIKKKKVETDTHNLSLKVLRIKIIFREFKF